MRFIPTRVHGMLDYLVGLILIVSPWVLGFDDATNRAAVWIPVILGVGALLYSLMTAYELGVVRVLSMPAHLAMDVASGVLLAASPWLFGFSNEVYLPHLIFGLLEIGAGLMTKTTPSTVHAGHTSQPAVGH
ncbi:MAG TPA: SPW repeat protein [Tepidisphaeraceae bacterium]|jgi:hypothetical protein